MANAEVGDEQRREDPTVLELERRGAELLGQEEAVYLPTATMGNQIALRILGEPGDRAVGRGARAHHGLRARRRGDSLRPADARPAGFSRPVAPEQLRATAWTEGDYWTPRTSIVALENTHNTAGGTVWPLEELREVVATARELGLGIHLDGARLLNAAVATRMPPAQIAGLADTVTLCLSKGLGCPLGALIAGSRELMERARVEKHRFGGAMRQAGIVAAAGLFALDHNVDRLAEDQPCPPARRGWAAEGLPVDLELVETNFVQVRVGELGIDEHDRSIGCARAGLRSRRRSPAFWAPSPISTSPTTTSSMRSPLSRQRSEPVSTSEVKLERLLAERQADRLPSVAAAVGRKGDVLFLCRRHRDYGEDRAATPDTQYRIGSITKTFTATAIMQLYAAGTLDLDDRLEQHIDGIVNGVADDPPSARAPLGLQREAGEMFVTGESPTEGQLIDSMSGIEFVSRPGEQHHYSNLAFALLGQVVARKTGLPYMQYVDERIIGPLGLTRTTWLPHEPQAQGYLVDEYARTVWTEPETDMDGTAAAGQLWSTVEDLTRWAAFLAEGADGVLDAKVVDEMWFPQVMYYPDDWVLGWGLGIMLYNADGGIYGGHGGAMAGTWPVSTSTARRASAQPG